MQDHGPFGVAGDLVLVREHRIQLIVSKNSGGTGASAKIAAARQLGLPIIMIARPAIPVIPARRAAHSVAAVLVWLHHYGPDRGV